ncbi:MAG: hypothetical protein AAB425_01345 [Bdellovibrionota bacterium]
MGSSRPTSGSGISPQVRHKGTALQAGVVLLYTGLVALLTLVGFVAHGLRFLTASSGELQEHS